MKISRLTKLLVFMVIYCLGVTASPAFSKAKEKVKAKGKQKVETKENHGREAGEQPFGLQQYSEKKGELPAGLQKKKDQDGQLTRGLENGGKNLKTTSKGKIPSR
jgi:competence protein ComGC